MTRVVLVWLVLCGSARAEEARVAPIMSGSAAGPSCFGLPPEVIPRTGATDVPRNAAIILFSTYPGVFTLTAPGFEHQQRVADLDPFRSTLFRMLSLPASQTVEVRVEGTLVTSFTTGGVVMTWLLVTHSDLVKADAHPIPPARVHGGKPADED